MAIEGTNVVTEFSPSGDYLACSDSSGALQIWETSTGIKRQQYVPGSHLSAVCSCLAWSPKRSAASSVSPTHFRRISLPVVPTLVNCSCPSYAAVQRRLEWMHTLPASRRIKGEKLGKQTTRSPIIVHVKTRKQKIVLCFLVTLLINS